MKNLILKTMVLTGSLVAVLLTSPILTMAEDDPHRVNETNSNETGIEGQAKTLVKNVKDVNGIAQKTHGSYQTNTNSCASCHMTHTANGNKLLIQDTVGKTCIACHDGSLGFYDVKSGKIFSTGPSVTIVDRPMKADDDYDVTTPMVDSTLSVEINSHGFQVGSTAGMFSTTTPASVGVSMHDVYSESIKVSAAPGGNSTGDGHWDKTFNCASCHSPHGSYSDRLLHWNPNGMATTSYEMLGNSIGEAGLLNTPEATTETLLKQVPVENISAPEDLKLTTKAQKYKLFRTDVTTHLTNISNAELKDIKNQVITADYFKTSDYGVTPAAIDGNVIMVYKWDEISLKYIPDLTPWVDENLQYNIDASYAVGFFTTTEASATIDNTNVSNGKDGNTTVNYVKAFAYSADGAWIDNVVAGHVGRAYVVKLDKIKVATHNVSGVELFVTNNGALVGEELEDHADNRLDGTAVTRYGLTSSAGMGAAMSYFCISCHTDYLSDGASNGGVYEAGYRHKTDFDRTSCVRCHYAHGTEQKVMRNASEENYKQLLETGEEGEEATLIDANDTSAIKRYVNMSSCWGCHSSMEDGTFINNDSYNNPNGMSLQGTWTSGNRWGIQWNEN
ncbi:MAG: doubled protein [Bacillales bacterium]|jgi:predicted CXXCH cytochrome family protein|nr:doubled protein [Bacillales bacterium]